MLQGEVLGYDVIGDIHGHAEVLENLLEHLGCERGQAGYRHDTGRSRPALVALSPRAEIWWPITRVVNR